MRDIRTLEQSLTVDRDLAVSIIEYAVRLGLPVPMEDVRVAAAAQFALDQIELDRLMGQHGFTPELLRRWEDYYAQQQKHTDATRKRGAMARAVWTDLENILTQA